MAISFEQFKIVLADEEARQQLRLNLTSEQADVLQSNEARAIAFYETWLQSDDAAAPLLQGPVAVAPFSGAAIIGFILSLLAVLSVGAAPSVASGGYGAALISLIVSGVAITATRHGEKRGNGLAIAGVVLACLAIAGLISINALAAGI